jgi:hypothetical protein
MKVVVATITRCVMASVYLRARIGGALDSATGAVLDRTAESQETYPEQHRDLPRPDGHAFPYDVRRRA